MWAFIDVHDFQSALKLGVVAGSVQQLPFANKLSMRALGCPRPENLLGNMNPAAASRSTRIRPIHMSSVAISKYGRTPVGFFPCFSLNLHPNCSKDSSPSPSLSMRSNIFFNRLLGND